jgi:hypothetical protein
VVEALGRDFTGVIDAHQGGSLAAPGFIQRDAGFPPARIPRDRAARPNRGKQGPKRPVQRCKYLICRVWKPRHKVNYRPFNCPIGGSPRGFGVALHCRGRFD